MVGKRTCEQWEGVRKSGREGYEARGETRGKQRVKRVSNDEVGRDEVGQ